MGVDIETENKDVDVVPLAQALRKGENER